jgi:hypothetical protein
VKKRIELEALVTEREGMLAENTHRANCEHSVAYTEEHFQKLADKIRKLGVDEPSEAYINWLQYRGHE